MLKGYGESVIGRTNPVLYHSFFFARRLLAIVASCTVQNAKIAGSFTCVRNQAEVYGALLHSEAVKSSLFKHLRHGPVVGPLNHFPQSVSALFWCGYTTALVWVVRHIIVMDIDITHQCRPICVHNFDGLIVLSCDSLMYI